MKRLITLLLAATTAFGQSQRTMTYNSLSDGQTIRGFRAAAVYLNDADLPIGARFIHERSGFTLDLLEIQSVPQAFIWVTTYPTSHMGEPHTQEHLLLGKGNRGRAVASQESMSLAGSSAFTAQHITCYHFYTAAGESVFYGEFERRLDALLHPDYTDEEVRREVRNFGVTEDSSGGTLGLEEKGSVYNEMVTSMDQPARRLYMEANSMIYGADHPLAFNSGGTPEALRVLQPEDIRKFHSENYHLANMGAIVSVPKEMSLESVLTRFDATLNAVEAQRTGKPVVTEKDLPAPRPAPEGVIRLVDYPQRNEQQAGQVRFVWPANRHLDATGQTLLSLFLQAFAGDPTTNLYKKFVDSRTRDFEFGAQSVFSGFEDYGGFPVTVGFGDVPVGRMNDRDLGDVRARILGELERIASWRDGSEEVSEFNRRVRSRIIELRRNLSKFVNSPPGFGFRGTGDDWLTHLELLNGEAGFRKSVTMKSVLDGVEQSIAGDANIWANYLSEWKLRAAQPWALAARPNPALIDTAQKEREERIASELARLKTAHGVSDDQAALRAYRDEYDARTAAIEEAASRVKPPTFIDNPPMTLDDQLDFRVSQLDNAIPLVTSTFDSMTSGTTGIALRLDGVSREQLVYLAMLPQLITRVGVVENGQPIRYEEMSERLRNEILSLNADFSTNSRTGRVEVVVRGSGNTLAEAVRALEWMQLVLFHADWRPENLPRIRDVADQTLSGLRRTMQTAEENWVRGVANAYWRQDNPLILLTTSFLTQTHNVQRLRWMLKEASPGERAAAIAALTQLADVKGSRAELTARLESIKAGSDKLLADAAKDLELTLPDIPDSTLAADWNHLCLEMATDLRTGPLETLARLETLRREVLKAGNARAFVIASTASQQAIVPGLRRLAAALDTASPLKTEHAATRPVLDRLREREPDASSPVFAGLLNPNSQGGVFLHSAPGPHYEDTGREKLLDYLSLSLYAGGGGHSLFMKTWGAGLAYSNGISGNLALGRITYYAERTPELPQTMRFVVDEIRRADYDSALVDYAIAQAFNGTRSASAYETRGEAMAANLADGLTPEVVERFHREIMLLRASPDLGRELFQRLHTMYGAVLPGLGGKVSGVPGGVYFVIGPEKQFAAWEEYLQSVEGPDARLYRLYPRDFWL